MVRIVFITLLTALIGAGSAAADPSQNSAAVYQVLCEAGSSTGSIRAAAKGLGPNAWTELIQRRIRAASTSNGPASVVSSSPHASRAGLEVLGKGGNAADAAAACLAALWVADPANTSVGGRCQMVGMVEGELFAIGGATQTPRQLEGPGEGWGLVPVPGNPAAVAELVRKHGRLPLSEVLQPAIDLAESGFPVPRHLAQVWKSREKDLERDVATARLFLPLGRSPREGELFVQTKLAQTIQRLEEFYSGEIGRTLVEDHKKFGGRVRDEDLGSYKVLRPTVLRAKYREYEIVTPGGNTWGHTLVEMLKILEHWDLARLEPAKRQEVLAWVILTALADRPQELGTLTAKPHGLPLALLVKEELAKDRAQRISHRLQQPGSANLADMRELVEQTGSPLAQVDHDTTHLSVVDRWGNAVSLTTSIGRHFGARVSSPSLGFLGAQSYTMANSPQPGSRDQTEMTPTLVLGDGKVVAVLGAAGSERIPQATLQTIVNFVDLGLSPAKAVAQPRMGWKKGELRLHCGLKEGAALRERGFPVSWTGWSHVNHLGIVQAVFVQPDGKTVGVADPAYDGQASSSATR